MPIFYVRGTSDANWSTAWANSIFFSIIWSLAPILVSVVAFFVYVTLGNELTVGTAFTVSFLFL